MSELETLSDAVSRIEQAEQAKKNSEKIDQKVAIAQTLISNTNSELRALASDLERLQFYRKLLDEAFNVSPPGSTSIETAQNAVQWDRHRFVRELTADELKINDVKAEDGPIVGGPKYQAYLRDIEDAHESIETDLQFAKNQLASQTETWQERLDSAEELQRIIGQPDDQFASTVDWLKRLVTQDMFNPGKSASSVVAEWDRALEQWNESEGLHGTDAFQREHDLSDQTMSKIRELSQNSSLELDDLKIETLREMKSVPALAEVVKLRI